MTVDPARVRVTTDQSRRDRLAAYCPVRQMLPFHRSTARRRFVRGPNKVGKSYGCAAEAWYHALGVHPVHGRLPHGAQSGTVLVADMSSVYAKVCAVLRQVEPGPMVDPSTRYDPEEGYYTGSSRYIRLRNGKSISFVGSEGPPVTLASGENGWLWVDEPPKMMHLGEALRSLAAKDWAPAWMDFTPIGRPVEALRLYVEGDPGNGIPPRSQWDVHVLRLAYDACVAVDWQGGPLYSVRTQQSIDTQIRDCIPGQEPQRLRGEWEGVAGGRAVPAFYETEHTRPLDLLADTINHLSQTAAGDGVTFCLSMDHGQGHGSQVAYLHAIHDRSAWTLGEWVAPPNSTATEVVRGVSEHLLYPLGLTWWHLNKVVGDVNAVGFGGSGATYNELLEEALLAYLRTTPEHRQLRQVPRHFEIPRKGPGSVKAGETALNTALKQGQWLIANTCKSLIRSLNYYTGGEEDLKHAVDGARYGLSDLWTQAPPSGAILVL